MIKDIQHREKYMKLGHLKLIAVLKTEQFAFEMQFILMEQSDQGYLVCTAPTVPLLRCLTEELFKDKTLPNYPFNAWIHCHTLRLIFQKLSILTTWKTKSTLYLHLTHVILVVSLTVICWTSPFSFKLSGLCVAFILFLMQNSFSKYCGI